MATGNERPAVGTEFWTDLDSDLQSPGFAREFAIQSVRISTIDAIINQLDEAREARGLSKAELARSVGSDPASVRRLFSSTSANPTLGTVAEVAAALGLRVRLEPATVAAQPQQ
jgi:DNA-binding phage protein